MIFLRFLHGFSQRLLSGITERFNKIFRNHGRSIKDSNKLPLFWATFVGMIELLWRLLHLRWLSVTTLAVQNLNTRFGAATVSYHIYRIKEKRQNCDLVDGTQTRLNFTRKIAWKALKGAELRMKRKGSTSKPKIVYMSRSRKCFFLYLTPTLKVTRKAQVEWCWNGWNFSAHFTALNFSPMPGLHFWHKLLLSCSMTHKLLKLDVYEVL